MFGWFRLIGLRMKTIAVVELDYRFKLEIAGGRHTTLFNEATRLTRDQGGNEYDAASKVMAMMTVVREEIEDERLDAMMRAPMRAAADHHKMVNPGQAEIDWEVAMSSLKDASDDE
jgi:hypothetical protein